MFSKHFSTYCLTKQNRSCNAGNGKTRDEKADNFENVVVLSRHFICYSTAIIATIIVLIELIMQVLDSCH